MNRIFAFAAAALVTAVLAVLLRKSAPETAMLLGIVLFAAILSALAGEVTILTEELRGIAQQAGIRSEILLPLLKVLGISVITGSAGAVCSDAGEKAAAYLLNLAGMICAFGAMVPLMGEVVEMLLEYL